MLFSGERVQTAETRPMSEESVAAIAACTLTKITACGVQDGTDNAWILPKRVLVLRRIRSTEISKRHRRPFLDSKPVNLSVIGTYLVPA